MTSDEIETLIRTVAPDLRGVPLYVLWASDMPAELRATGPLGYTGGQLDWTCRPWLTATGRWQGRGPVIVLDREAIVGDAGSDEPELIEPRLTAVVCHELSHILERPVDILEPTDADNHVSLTLLRLSVPMDTSLFLPRVPLWSGHGGRWVRLLCHAVYRFERQGHRVIPALTGWQRFELSHLHEYAAAMGDEPEAMLAASFAEIRRTEPPTAFRELWNADVLRWFHSLSDTTVADWTLLALNLNCFRKDT